MKIQYKLVYQFKNSSSKIILFVIKASALFDFYRSVEQPSEIILEG